MKGVFHNIGVEPPLVKTFYIFQTDVDADSVDVWDLLRDMRAKFSLAKNLLNVDDSNKEISGGSLNTNKNKESLKPKSLAW